MRNALLLDDRFDAAQDWTPPDYPPDFKLDHAAPYPEFAAAVQKMGLLSMPNDWDRALAISKHLLGSSPVLKGGAIQSDLLDTYRRITNRGEGYCGDFVDVFIGLANAAGIPTRPWAFSFDGFGGHGHIWIEIWNRQAQAWQLVRIFNNNYFVLEDGRPLSALEFHRALKERPEAMRMLPLYAGARRGMPIEATARSYYLRGGPEWYQWRGTNVFSYAERRSMLRLGIVSQSLAQLYAIVSGVSPRLVILSSPENQAAHVSLRRLRSQLFLVAVTVPFGILSALLCWVQLRRCKNVGEQLHG